nr:reverse transcriptase domain-containing protein [Tanacetum cinerariifolium]
ADRDPSCHQGHEARDERYAERVDISAREVKERESQDRMLDSQITRRQIMVRTRRGHTPPPTNPNNMTPEAVQTMIDQALLRNSGGGDGSHISHAENPRNMHTARTDCAVGLTRWIKKMESVFNISGCDVENQVKFATCTLLD